MKQENYSEGAKSTLECYQSDLSKHKMLSLAEENKLKKIYPTATKEYKKEIQDRFVEGNLRLAYKKALRYQNLGLPLEDLIMEANLGLCRAAEEFDFTVATRFSSYAGYWIQAALTEAIQNKSRIIRMPVNHQHQIAAEKKANAGASELEAKSAKTINIHKTINEEGDSLVDMIANPYAEMPDAVFTSNATLQDSLNKFMNVLLDEREQRIIKDLFGIGGEERGLVDIAEEEGISAERVRQIGKHAMQKMQKFKHKLHV